MLWHQRSFFDQIFFDLISKRRLGATACHRLCLRSSRPDDAEYLVPAHQRDGRSGVSLLRRSDGTLIASLVISITGLLHRRCRCELGHTFIALCCSTGSTLITVRRIDYASHDDERPVMEHEPEEAHSMGRLFKSFHECSYKMPPSPAPLWSAMTRVSAFSFLQYHRSNTSVHPLLPSAPCRLQCRSLSACIIGQFGNIVGDVNNCIDDPATTQFSYPRSWRFNVNAFTTARMARAAASGASAQSAACRRWSHHGTFRFNRSWFNGWRRAQHQ